ncbi:MAG: carbohydrate kinase [Candidatus Methanofastidiosia archaeon]
MNYKRHLVLPDLVCFGELLWDIYEDGEEKIGGAPFNVAALASLTGIRTLMITAVGNDEQGKRIQAAASKKIPLLCQTNEHETGTVQVTRDKNKNPAFLIADDVAYDYITYDTAMAHVCSAAKFFCFGTLAQRHSVSRTTLKTILKSTNAVKIYDFNYREEIKNWESLFAESVEITDILKVNEQELGLIKTSYKSEESDERVVTRLMQHNNLQYVFVTRGEKGASLYSETAVLHRAAAEVEVVDTTGCGDAFTAGVVHSLVNKVDEERMLDYAVELAGKVAGRRGAVV